MGMKVNGTSGLTFPDTTTLGSAGQSSVQAWVNFNGTGTVAIRANFNVSSITDNGTGDYTVNFTNALVDANYAVTGSADGNGDATRGFTGMMAIKHGTTPATGSVRLAFGLGSNTVGNGQLFDSAQSCVAIFR